jgi:hypothetical protein
LSRRALSTAATGEPPAAITPTAASCDPPANTNRDIAQAMSGEIPDAEASAPKETPMTPIVIEMKSELPTPVLSDERIVLQTVMPGVRSSNRIFCSVC